MSNKKNRRAARLEEAEIALIVGEQVSVATVEVNGVWGLGEAKRMSGDVWNERIGSDLAIGRALRDASDQLLKRHRA